MDSNDQAVTDNYERLDPRAVAKVAGGGYAETREIFRAMHEAAIAMSPTVSGTMTTIYIKYVDPEVSPQPFAVLWIKKSTEMIMAFSHPDDYSAVGLLQAERPYKYADLNTLLTVSAGHKVPDQLGEWMRDAYQHRAATA